VIDPEGIIQVLCQGADVWNRFREMNRGIEIDLSGGNLERMVLIGADLSGVLLSGARLDFADLTGANLSGAELSGARLSHSRLSGARLTLANLEDARLPFIDAENTDFRGACLSGAFMEDANLKGANLSNTQLNGAMLAHANLRDATLEYADLSGANLSAVDLDRAFVANARYDRRSEWAFLRELGFSPKRIWGRRKDIVLNTTLRCKGVNAACYGSQGFRRFLLDQDYLEEMTETPKGRAALFVWWLLANCGRSIARWALWSLILTLLFALMYLWLGTAHFETVHLPFGFFTAFYHSVVTMTTLGTGDVIPKTTVAASLMMIEVLGGYVMLGGLISIFSLRLARRAG
jgi:hypothetical protein